jgi:hypothetical protein
MSKDQRPEQVNLYNSSVQLMSPNKMLVESATMIFILAFMLCAFVMLIWKGSSLSSGQIMMGVFGLLFTMTIAVRQYASFR